VWNVVLVAEHELQGVLARGQRYFGFGLAGAKVQMLEVVRYFRVERRRGRIDDQMMMTRIGAVRARGRNPHAAQAEMKRRSSLRSTTCGALTPNPCACSKA
jgi:hypothetical protein